MKELESEIQRITSKLTAVSDQLIAALNTIFQIGVPQNADKVVLWIPLGHRYTLRFTYMSNDANEIGKFPRHFESLDAVLESLLDGYDEYESEKYHRLSRLTDTTFAQWLQQCLAASSFKDVTLPKVMAINNVCAYFDLETLEQLRDDEMWS